MAAKDTHLTNFDALRQGRAPAAKGVGRTAGAVVLFHPDLNTLGGVVGSVAAQVSDLILIANDGAPWSCSLPKNAVLARQERNLGLGAAYNLAARWASERGATHLLLLDQDSVAAPGMVAALLEAFEQPGPVAASGPLWRDSRTGDDGFVRRGVALGHAPVHAARRRDRSCRFPHFVRVADLARRLRGCRPL